MFSRHAKEFLAHLRLLERSAKAEAKRQESAKKHFDAECVRLMREEIRLVKNNRRSNVSWKHYE